MTTNPESLLRLKELASKAMDPNILVRGPALLALEDECTPDRILGMVEELEQLRADKAILDYLEGELAEYLHDDETHETHWKINQDFGWITGDLRCAIRTRSLPGGAE